MTKDISIYLRPRYIDSKNSSTVYAGILATPTLSINGTATTTTGLLSWSNVDSNTSYYELYYSFNGGTWALYDNNIFASQTTYQLVNTLPVGQYAFKIRASATITDSSTGITTHFYSAFSDATFTFIVAKLETPVLSAVSGLSEYYWNIITNAQTYSFVQTKNNTTTTTTVYKAVDIPTSINPIKLKYSDTGSYVLSVIALNSNEFLYHASDTSNTLTYSVYQLATPMIDSAAFIAEPPTITWAAITSATGYNIKLNNSIIANDYMGLTYDFSSHVTTDVTSYVAEVQAEVAGQNDYANPFYISSNFSDSLAFGTIPTPVIAFNATNDNEIDITNYDKLKDNTEYFIIYNNGVELAKLDVINSSYNLNTSSEAVYSITLKAFNDTQFIGDSAVSNELTYAITKLKAPVVSITSANNENISLSWSAITNAQYYDIYVNGVKSYITSSLSSTIDLPVGLNSIYIVARSSFKRYLTSDASNVIYKNIEATSNYLASINGTFYQIYLPYTEKETLDETMDTATLTLAPINRAEPFEAYTDIEIIISDSVDSDGNVHYIDGYPKHMLINEDSVDEVVIGTRSLYSHHIECIERTKLLENVLMPDFSITQPLDYSIKVNTSDPYTVTPTCAYSKLNSSAGWIKLVQKSADRATAYTKIDRSVYIAGPESLDPIGNLNSFYYMGNTVTLPYLSNSSMSFKIRFLNMYEYNILTPANVTYDSWQQYGVKVLVSYYYADHDSSIKTLIGQTTDDSNIVTWTIPYGLTSGSYDIIMTVTIPYPTQDTLFSKIGYTGNSTNAYLEFGYDANDAPRLVAGTPSSSLVNAYIQDDSAYGQADLAKLKTLTVKWKNISIVSSGETTTTNKIAYTYKSIYDGITKAIDIAKPLEGSNTAKYNLDTDFNYFNENGKTLTNSAGKIIYDQYGDPVTLKTYPCPELKFENQKSLYEVLTEFGRLFYGIPRLGKYVNGTWDDNCITFDVLDQSTIDAANTAQFEDQNTAQSQASTMDNHATGYVSNLSNVINNQYPDVYPSGNAWITPRSSSSSDPLVSKNNMAIVLPKNIYRLVSVLVKNVLKNYPDNYYDITNYVDEATIYDSLNNDATGKGISIYYTQGSNMILGLGQIPEQDETQAILGLDSDIYIIQNILLKQFGVALANMTDVNTWKYKVSYISYNNLQVYTERSNIASLQNTSYKALDQENNVIYDSYFGKSAQTQIERLGNNSITKNYRYMNWTTMPKLGQVETFNGHKYYADSIIYKFNNNYREAQVSFSKNFNKINERVGIDSSYRLFRISTIGYVSRSINLNRYCFLSHAVYGGVANTIPNMLYNNLTDSFYTLYTDGAHYSIPTIKPDSYYIKALAKDGTTIQQYNDYYGNLKDIPSSLLSATYNTFNNSISFSAEFYDNYSAGITATETYTPPASADTTQRKQQDVRYVDTNGELPDISITLCRPTQDNLETTLNSGTYNYPAATTLTQPSALNDTIYSQTIQLDKDALEKIQINWQLQFQTYDAALTIHQGITSRLFSNYSIDGVKDMTACPVYYFYKGDITKMTKLVNVPAQEAGSPAWSSQPASACIQVQAVTATPDKAYDGYCLVWPSNKAIIYDYKQALPAGTAYTIPALYLNFSDDKPAYKTK